MVVPELQVSLSPTSGELSSWRSDSINQCAHSFVIKPWKLPFLHSLYYLYQAPACYTRLAQFEDLPIHSKNLHSQEFGRLDQPRPLKGINQVVTFSFPVIKKQREL